MESLNVNLTKKDVWVLMKAIKTYTGIVVAQREIEMIPKEAALSDLLALNEIIDKLSDAADATGKCQENLREGQEDR